MKFFVIIKEEAEVDLIEIFDYCKAQRVALGDRFLDSFENTLQKKILNPFHTFKISEYIRRAVTDKFPYSVYFTVAENNIVVFAVLHQSRKPDKILKRLK